MGLSGATEWELAKDRELDEMTDEQLRYLFKAIQVTLDEREPAWYLVMNGVSTGAWRMTTCDAFRGPFTHAEALAALAKEPPSRGRSDT